MQYSLLHLPQSPQRQQNRNDCLPAPGDRCRYTGLSRSTLNELTIAGPANDGVSPVNNVVVRKRGALRGIRLISYDSLMAYLTALS